jgi:hypothetical protein
LQQSFPQVLEQIVQTIAIQEVVMKIAKALVPFAQHLAWERLRLLRSLQQCVLIEADAKAVIQIRHLFKRQVRMGMVKN